MQPVDKRLGRRFAWYAYTVGNPTKAPTWVAPMQRSICAAIVEESGGEITAEFIDYEGTNKAELDRLIDEARNSETRRFDTVIVYFPSQLDPGVGSAREREEEITATGVDLIVVGNNLLGPHSQATS